jgi:hypothetical protein
MIRDLYQEAMRLVEDALDKPPAELRAEVDEAERAVAALRDELIERWRVQPTHDVRHSLDRVNVALSLLIGLEYPVGGVQRDMLDQARGALAGARLG